MNLFLSNKKFICGVTVYIVCNLLICLIVLVEASSVTNSTIRTTTKVINRAVRTNTGHVVRQKLRTPALSHGTNQIFPVNRGVLASKQVVPLIKPVFKIQSNLTGVMTSIALTSNGRLCVTGSSNGAAQLWDLRTGQRVFDLRVQAGSVLAVTFSKNNNFIITGHKDGKVCLWDVHTGQKKRTFIADAVFSVSALKDEQFATASKDGFIKIWDIKTGNLKNKYAVNKLSAMTANRAGDKIIAGTTDGKIYVLNKETGEIESTSETGESSVLCLDAGKSNFIAVGLKWPFSDLEYATWKKNCGSKRAYRSY